MFVNDTLMYYAYSSSEQFPEKVVCEYFEDRTISVDISSIYIEPCRSKMCLTQ